MENDKLAFALRDLIEYVTSGRRYKSVNPYCVPEVETGLKALCQYVVKTKAYYLDGKEIFEKEMIVNDQKCTDVLD